MKSLAWAGIIKKILLGCLLILIMTVLLQKNEVKAATDYITAGDLDTVSVFDMKSSSLKELSIASSNKDVKVKKKIYTDKGVKHTAVLAWAPYSMGEDETATITLRYYDIKNKKTVSVKKKVRFLADYNGGYASRQKLATVGRKVFTIGGSAKLQSVNCSLDRYESSMFAPFSGGGDGEEFCSITSSKARKTFTIHTFGYGMGSCYVAASFINGEYKVYRFDIIVPEKDGTVYTRKLKLTKDKSTVLYFSELESGGLSVHTTEEGIISTEITENKTTKEATLILKGLKEGRTEVELKYNAKGIALVNKYIIHVVDPSPVEKEIRLTPKEVDQSYSCIYQLTDSSGNLLKATTGTQYMEISPDSPEVRINSADWDYFDLEFSRPGTYHITVRIKDLEDKTVEKYGLTILAGELSFSDYETITLSSEAEAKAYFCGEEYRSWSSGECKLGFHDNGVITSYWDSNPWLFKSGDYVPGDATYSFDIEQQKIIIKDYDITMEIMYEIISEKHVRLTIKGRTWDFIRK